MKNINYLDKKKAPIIIDMISLANLCFLCVNNEKEKHRALRLKRKVQRITSSTRLHDIARMTKIFYSMNNFNMICQLKTVKTISQSYTNKMKIE